MRRAGFTLVEVMIVVAILGILGAIVLPTYQGNAGEAKISSAKSNLHTMRTQIELYKMHHNGVLPGYDSGSLTTENFFRIQLIGTTTVNGEPALSKTPTYPYLYGPYLMSIPTNPFNGESHIAYSTDFATDAGTEGVGWLYNPNTGEICLNRSGTDEQGVAYIAY